MAAVQIAGKDSLGVAQGPVDIIVDRGSARVTLARDPGFVYRDHILFNATGDLPADNTSRANVASTMVTLSGYPSGYNRVRITWHDDANGNRAIGAMISINPVDIEAAKDALTLVDVGGGGSVTSPGSAGARISKTVPLFETTLYDTDGTLLDISTIYIVGIRSNGGTTDGNFGVTVEVF